MPNFNASVENIDRTLHVLCREIGNRVGASAAELRAAEFVADEMRALGLQNVTLERFPFDLWGYEVARVQVLGEHARALAAIPVANSPATPAAGLEAEVVYVDHGTPADLALHEVEGKIVLVWGSSHGSDADALRALNDCGCVGVLWVDDRFPTDWPVAIGTPFDWRRLLDKPQLGIAYWDGLRLAREPGARVRMFSDAWSRPGESVNVFGDLPGSGEEFVHIGAHLDSVVVGVGAEDDGSGVAAMLEAARMLVGEGTPARTIRFCGFGAEEQLSEGSRQYVAAHGEEAARTRVVLNLDSMAAITGRNQFLVTGPEELVAAVRGLMDPAGPVITGEVLAEVSPFSDMFPFNIAGAPSVFFHRMNQAGTRYFHHSHLDDLPSISSAVIATHANALAHLAHLSAFTDPPFARAIPAEQMREVEDLAAKYFGG